MSEQLRALVDSKNIPLMDALRGFAILFILILHTGQTLSAIHPFPEPFKSLITYCQYGVQLFFIVSAWTLFLSLSKQSSPNFFKFYIRRTRRLCPLFYAGIIFYSLKDYIFSGNIPDLQSILLSLSLMHIWLPSSLGSLVPGGWSIGVEFQFYLILPLIFKLIRSRLAAILLLLLCLPLSEIITYSIQDFLYSHFDHESIAYYNYFWPVRQMPIFTFGILLYFLTGDFRKNYLPLAWFNKSLFFVAAILALGCLGAINNLIDKHYFHIYFSLIFSLAAYTLATLPPSKLLVNSITVYLGKISYSIYIWHFFFMQSLFLLFKNTFTNNILFNFTLLFLSSFICTVIFANFTYKRIEQRFWSR